MKRITIFLSIFAAFTFLVSSCYNDSSETLYRFVQSPCDTTNVTYSGVVSAIVAGNCLSCHSSSVASGGYVLDNYAGLQAVAASGQLVNSVTYVSHGMPQSGKMDACKINQIVAWVNKGAQNN